MKAGDAPKQYSAAWEEIFRKAQIHEINYSTALESVSSDTPNAYMPIIVPTRSSIPVLLFLMRDRLDIPVECCGEIRSHEYLHAPTERQYIIYVEREIIYRTGQTPKQLRRDRFRGPSLVEMFLIEILHQHLYGHTFSTTTPGGVICLNTCDKNNRFPVVSPDGNGGIAVTNILDTELGKGVCTFAMHTEINK